MRVVAGSVDDRPEAYAHMQITSDYSTIHPYTHNEFHRACVERSATFTHDSCVFTRVLTDLRPIKSTTILCLICKLLYLNYRVISLIETVSPAPIVQTVNVTIVKYTVNYAVQMHLNCNIYNFM